MKPYKITKDVLTKIKKEFEKAIKSYTTADTDFVFEYTPPTKKANKLTIYCLPSAYCKMQTLVQETDTEIAWHLCVTKIAKTKYFITDVLVYPQTVSGATVTTDDTKYTMWLAEQPDDVFNTIKGQGHSHVKMGVSPSGVDRKYYADLLTATHKGFYLFLIMNKSGSIHLEFYDIDNNMIYEPEDITFTVATDKWNSKEWYKEAVKQLERPRRTWNSNYFTSSKLPSAAQQSYFEGDDWFDRFK